MITLEDLLEEIVGEIRDEYDADEEDLIKKISDNEYLVDASMKLDDINDALETTFNSEDFDSIGGIMIELLDRFPTDDEQVVTEDGTTLIAKEVIQNRIEKVLIILPEKTEAEEDTEPSDLSVAEIHTEA